MSSARMVRFSPPSVVLAVLATLLAALFAGAPAAQAADTYRYWGYYQYVGGTWQYYQTGPDESTPKDGAVEGWRFAAFAGASPRTPRLAPDWQAVCGGTAAETGKKRVLVILDYGRVADSLGGATEPPVPVAKCALVASAASGAQVLAAVATVRVDQQMTCGIDNVPATGCSSVVKDVTAAMSAPDGPLPGATGAPNSTTAGVGTTSSSTPSPVSTATGSSSATSPATVPATSGAPGTPTVSGDSDNSTPIILGVVALLAMAAIGVTIARRNKATQPIDPDA